MDGCVCNYISCNIENVYFLPPFRQATGHKDGPKTKCCARLLAESFHYPHQATPPYLNLEQ